MYRLVFSKEAQKHLKLIHSKHPELIKKLTSLLVEIEKHPYTGTGHPEPMKHFKGDLWSRRIDKKNRIVYSVIEENILVSVISLFGHYGDK